MNACCAGRIAQSRGLPRCVPWNIIAIMAQFGQVSDHELGLPLYVTPLYVTPHFRQGRDRDCRFDCL